MEKKILYKKDIVFGDTSSFATDILLNDYYLEDIRRNR